MLHWLNPTMGTNALKNKLNLGLPHTVGVATYIRSSTLLCKLHGNAIPTK